MYYSAWVVLLTGGILQPMTAAAAATPQSTAEEALAVEQSDLRNVLHPSCVQGGDEIVVCGGRQPYRERLPRQEERGQAIRGEPLSAVTVMNAAETPRAQHVGPRPRGGATVNFINVAAVLLMVGERLVDRDRPPPPIPPD